MRTFRPGGALYGEFPADAVEAWSQWHAAGDSDKPEDCALPLWWDGALVPEGLDRAWRVHPWAATTWSHMGAEEYLARETLENVVRLAESLALFPHIASRVVRLHRVDGRLVEAP